MFENTITLANGVTVPQLALGTWLIDNNKAADAVKAAINIGYRHIDTAQAYMNEAGVGKGIRKCGVSRDEIFVTTKVAAEHKDYKSARVVEILTAPAMYKFTNSPYNSYCDQQDSELRHMKQEVQSYERFNSKRSC